MAVSYLQWAARTTADFGMLLLTLVLWGFLGVMLIAFAVGLPLAIIDYILPGSPIGLQSWAQDNPSPSNYR